MTKQGLSGLAALIYGLAESKSSYAAQEQQETERQERRRHRLEEIQARADAKIRVIEAERKLMEEERLNNMNRDVHFRVL